MTGALLLRPTVLSLGSLVFLMECSQDHFTYEALDEQVGDDSDGVVVGDIYFHDMIFLTLISRHKKKDLHAAHDSFLSSHMETYQTIMERFSWEISLMDLITSFPTVHGKSCVFVIIYHLTKYFHSLAIYIQCIAPQEGKFLFGLHGLSKTKIYDGYSHFLYGFGQVLCYYLCCHSQRHP